MEKQLDILEEPKEIFSISEICTNSFFCIQINKQLNNLKEDIIKKTFPNENDIHILNEEINLYENKIKLTEKEKVFDILDYFYDSLNNLNEIPKQNSDYAIKIKSIIDEYTGIKAITLKYIKNKYKELYNKEISLMTISRILRFHLGFHYRKTKVKNPLLSSNNYILMSYGFIEGIIKAITLKLNIVYLDECGFQIENNNLRIWRKSENEILAGSKKDLKKKINLILAINSNEILLGNYYKNESISSKEFIEFIEDLIKNYNQQKINETIFICDNAKYHLSKEVKKYFKEKKLKFLFNVPYKSNFNCIELCFNLIKNILYKEIYKNIKDLENRICFLLDDKELNQHINKIYVKTLKVYRQFYIQNQEIIKNMAQDEQFLLNKKMKRKRNN